VFSFSANFQVIDRDQVDTSGINLGIRMAPRLLRAMSLRRALIRSLWHDDTNLISRRTYINSSAIVIFARTSNQYYTTSLQSFISALKNPSKRQSLRDPTDLLTAGVLPARLLLLNGSNRDLPIRLRLSLRSNILAYKRFIDRRIGDARSRRVSPSPPTEG
jgi:hypothetical protein